MNNLNIVICDSSPLIALSKIKRLPLLFNMFKKVIIPDAVFYECTVKSSFADSDAIKELKGNSNVEIKTVPSFDVLQQNPCLKQIDRGEREAIILAIRCAPAPVILIDDEKGRMIANSFSLKIIGICGLLASAYKKGFIGSKNDVHNDLLFLCKNNYRLSVRLIEKTLNSIV